MFISWQILMNVIMAAIPKSVTIVHWTLSVLILMVASLVSVLRTTILLTQEDILPIVKVRHLKLYHESRYYLHIVT